MLEVQRWKAGMISSNRPDIKAVFRARVTIRNKKRHSEMVAGSAHQEDTTIERRGFSRQAYEEQGKVAQK